MCVCVCVDVCGGACVSACLCDWLASEPVTMSTHPGDWPCRRWLVHGTGRRSGRQLTTTIFIFSTTNYDQDTLCLEEVRGAHRHKCSWAIPSSGV